MMRTASSCSATRTSRLHNTVGATAIGWAGCRVSFPTSSRTTSLKPSGICTPMNQIQWDATGTSFTNAYVNTLAQARTADSLYVTNGIFYPLSATKLSDISDGTSNTILFGETSAVIGRTPGSAGLGGIQPWTWGYWNQ